MDQRFKALSTSVLLLVFVAGAFPFPGYAFFDVPSSEEYREAIESLQEKGVIEGYEDGTFRPLSGINRAEFLKILLEGRGKDISQEGDCFPDVKDQWFSPYVCAAEEEGIVSGYPDGFFRPERPINFVEAAKMLSLAYGQQLPPASGEWYAPYANALESSSAIPLSIPSLDAPLKRGEMAEMMWRLSEGKTDEPTKGVLNLKYPDVRINLASKEPQKAGSCSDLKAFVEEQNFTPPMLYMKAVEGAPAMMNDAMAPSERSQQSAGTSGGGSGDYSKTNVQVAGVDEGDIVKTDGNYVYVLSQSDQSVRIVDARDPQDLKVLSTIVHSFSAPRGGVSFSPQEIYVEGNRLIIVGQKYDSVGYPVPMPLMEDSSSKMMAPMIYPPMYGTSKTSVRIYDIQDRTKPSLAREVAFEGSRISSRLTDGKILLVSTSGPRWYGIYAETKKASEDALVPVFDDSARKIENDPVVRCTDVTILPRIPRPSYLVVASIPLTGSAEVDRSVILGEASNVYVSEKNIFVASGQYHYFWGGDHRGIPEEKTNLYRFAYSPTGVSFEATGAVPGHILNQFSMDEYGETFRIATTKSQQWSYDGTRSKPSTNNLYILSGDLDLLGSVEDIAPGESIYAVRFLGKRAYMVTFKQIDPLFVIDTSSPRSPKILGKLKIPGYSNYLHPLDENHIIGFGKEVDETIDADKVHSDDAVYYTAVLGMKMGLFDVSDVEHPKEIAKEVIGSRGTESPLLYDHKALFFDSERRVLAFPVTVMTEKASPASLEVFRGAYVYDFSTSTGFKLRGKISHIEDGSATTNSDFFNDGWSAVMSDIHRIFRIGENLFSVSSGFLKSSDIKTLKDLDIVSISDTKYSDTPYPLPIDIIPMTR